MPQENKMAHPIHQANENNPFGNLTREEFYKQHHILHQESFMLNNQNMKIFTQFWSPDSTPRLRGVVAMVHGYASESSWLFELTAVATAKAGFFVCALDLQGHGHSDGLPGHIPDIQPVVHDCIQFFNLARANHPNLPAFLYGESLGGAIAILICLRQRREWSGLILSGAMCEVSAKLKPMRPLEKLLPVADFFAPPTWGTMVTKPLASMSYKEKWKRKLVANNPNRPNYGRVPAATTRECLRVTENIRRNCHELEVPMLVLHGEDDMLCDSDSARFVYESSVSKDKTLKIFPGMWHLWIGEPNESVELVFGIILSWIGDRAEKAKIRTKL